MGSAHRNVSYWIATAPETSFPAYQGDELRVDVAVLGGGITGLTTAMLLKQTGVSVTVVESGRVACGVTGYTTAKVTSLHGLTYAKLTGTFGQEGARTYGEANQEGIALIERLVQQLGLDCDFEPLPAYTYTEDPLRVSAIEEEVEAAQQAGLPASFSTDIGLPFPVQGAVCFEEQAQFHPRRFCVGLAEASTATAAECSSRPEPWTSGLASRARSRLPTAACGPSTSCWPPTCPSSTLPACSPKPPHPAPMRWP